MSMNKFSKGSLWRKWDLHVHTKDTKKNDQFTSKTFDEFCITMFQKALTKNISAIGITDYFNLENYKRVKEFVTKIDKNSSFNSLEQENIKNIFLLPNVELRILPATDKGTLINIHCLFNPDEDFLSTLENNFFSSLETSSGYKMNRSGIIDLGKSSRPENCDENTCYQKGINLFHLSPEQLKNIFKKHSSLRDNCIISVSNSSSDGNSSLQKHYDLFEHEEGSLDDVRSNIYKISQAIFSGNPKDRLFFLGQKKGVDKKSILDNCGSLKACIHGSDAHSEEELFTPKKDRFCWIKSDLTFEGLKQIIYEPEERVYIGEKPPILSKVENNKTRYLKTLIIEQVNTTHSGDIWFNKISIDFNKELVAIIGNKGSGKSGIADILGLVGDTHTDKKYFSFLHKKKFLQGKLADKFHAHITWESGGKSDKILLSAKPNTDKPESVRFIPQNYFEELTNKIDVSEFQRVLEKIIFGYISDDEKFDKSSFQELEKYKTENVNKDIQIQKNSIQSINNEIIELEKKKHPDYIRKINGFIDKKETDIQEQKKQLEDLPKILNPNTGDKDSGQKNNIIEQHNLQLEALKKQLKEKETEKSKVISKIESITQFKITIEQQKQSLDEFLQKNSEKAIKFDLDIGNILKVEADYSSIDRLLQESYSKLKKVKVSFETFESIKERSAEGNNESLIYKIKFETEQLKVETDKLTGEARAFQKNEQRKKEIEETIQKLTGDVENPAINTLSFYRTEKAFIENKLADQLNMERNHRIEKSLDIFKKKNEIIALYNAFKRSVDDKITQNKDLLQDYDIKIDSSFNLNTGFYRDFLGHINKGRKGCFYGSDNSEDKIKAIIEDSGFSNEDQIKALLRTIIHTLEENDAIISEQVNKEKLSSFYDYLFSLDYIESKYELKLGGKVLSQLSPGERGALLLIFYLIIDEEEIPLVIDQPEDNLDNESVYSMLSCFIKKAKKKRQIIMVTHNPNLAVGADAEQIIHVHINKQNKNEFTFTSGSIENPEINQKIIQILEGTKPAFDKRKLKYQEKK
ncbi:MAG: hypothetical protein Q9M28_04405 [Mariprofundaceae bacterium]|nr:hypothetical protein [Mariprofundaceae bacterium]